jgi:hypothetical protein
VERVYDHVYIIAIARGQAEQRITRATRPLELRLATLEARWEQLSSGRTGAAAATSQPDAKGAVEDPASGAWLLHPSVPRLAG